MKRLTTAIATIFGAVLVMLFFTTEAEALDIDLEPIEISIIEKIGKIFSPDDLEKIPIFIESIEDGNSVTSNEIEKICLETVYNIGQSAKIGAAYIKELNNK